MKNSLLRRSPVPFLVLALAGGTGSVLAQVSLTTADGFGADTYFSNDSQNASTGADDAHGAETTIQLRYLPGTRLRMPVLLFDVSAVDKSTAGWAAGISLQLELTTAQNNTRTLSLYGIPDSMDELITDATSYDDAGFINQPGETGVAHNSGNWQFDGGTANTFEGLTFLSSFSNPAASIGVKTFANSAAFESFAEADSNGRLLFLVGGPTAGETYMIAAQEHATAWAPTLSLPAAVVPEPSSMALAALGGLALLRGARWRS